jgi:hypothetical protein
MLLKIFVFLAVLMAGTEACLGRDLQFLSSFPTEDSNEFIMFMNYTMITNYVNGSNDQELTMEEYISMIANNNIGYNQEPTMEEYDALLNQTTM